MRWATKPGQTQCQDDATRPAKRREREATYNMDDAYIQTRRIGQRAMKETYYTMNGINMENLQLAAWHEIVFEHEKKRKHMLTCRAEQGI